MFFCGCTLREFKAVIFVCGGSLARRVRNRSNRAGVFVSVLALIIVGGYAVAD